MCWIAVAYHHTNVYWKCCRKLQKYAIAGDKDDCVLKMRVSKANYLSSKPFGGDGWCDTINNRAYCQYDGGDCCPSTLSTKKVKLNPFKRSILTQWSCWESNKPCVSLKWAFNDILLLCLPQCHGAVQALWLHFFIQVNLVFFFISAQVNVSLPHKDQWAQGKAALV